jgi:alkanesulfonate monooxygenase
MSLRFHWMLPKGGEVARNGRQSPEEACRYRIDSTSSGSPAPRPDMPGWLHFAREAERAGIDSLLISFSRYEPDPFMVACALGQATESLRFMLAYRSGLVQPTTFVQQINTLSALIGGRLSVNLVAGSSRAEQRGYGDLLAHDERYARAEEFLEICRAFWSNEEEVDFEGRYYRVEGGKLHTPFLAPGRSSPEIYISGHSEQSERLAAAHGSSWLRVVDRPETLEPIIAPIRARGIGVCLRLCLICRPTRDEALHVAESLLAVAGAKGPEDGQRMTTRLKDDSLMHRQAALASGSEHWLNHHLWTGLVPFFGPVWTTMLGTPQDLAEAFLAYERIGVTELILSGWPEADEVATFGREVLPLIRQGERRGEPRYAEVPAMPGGSAHT